MLKFLFIVLFLGFITMKTVGFITRVFLSGLSPKKGQNNFGDKDVKIKPDSKKKPNDFKGGEYIDYEEVK